MHILLIESILLFLLQIQHFFSSMDPAYLDVVKIFAGSIGWIGSLTIFMLWKDKRKQTLVVLNTNDK